MVKKSKYLNILLSLISVIIFLGGIELYLRVIKFHFYINYDPWIISMLNQGRYIPDTKTLFKINPNYSGFAHINSQGFRDTREYDFHKEKGVYRIACIGDSVTFGVGSEDIKECYPKILENILNDNNHRVKYEVLNFGVPGYTSYQGLKLLETYLLHYSLDLAIICFGWNDIWKTPQWAVEDKNQRIASASVVKFLNILQRFKVYQLLEKIIYDVQSPFRKRPEEKWHTRVSLEDYKENYRKMISLLKREKIDCLVIIPPADIRKRQMDRYKAYCTAVRGVVEEFNVSIIEPDELFAKESKIYFTEDCVHLTALGNLLLAKNIFLSLKKNGFIK